MLTPLQTQQHPILKAIIDDGNTVIRGVHLLETNIRTMRELSAKQPGSRPEQVPEVLANLTLALRHCEDARARMRYALQHAGDGVTSDPT